MCGVDSGNLTVNGTYVMWALDTLWTIIDVLISKVTQFQGSQCVYTNTNGTVDKCPDYQGVCDYAASVGAVCVIIHNLCIPQVEWSATSSFKHYRISTSQLSHINMIIPYHCVITL